MLLCNVIDVIVSTVGNDPTGRLTDVYLWLQAPASPLKTDIVEECWFDRDSVGKTKVCWDHGRPSDNVLVDLIITTLQLSESDISSACQTNGLILLAKEDRTHIRIGVFQKIRFWENGQAAFVPEELVAFGIGLRQWKEGEGHIEDETKVRTFKIV